MKKFIAIIAVLISVTAYGQRRDERIIKDGLNIVPIAGRLIVPFYTNDFKFGFVRNSSSMTVLIEPYYDSVDNGPYALVPVKKNGKWGVVDCLLREPSANQPIVPCIYDSITIVDNNTIKATVNGKTKTITYDKQRN